MIKISIRLPDDHPINKIPDGQRSRWVRDLIDVGYKCEECKEENLKELKEFKQEILTMFNNISEKLLGELFTIKQLIKVSTVPIDINNSEPEQHKKKGQGNIVFDHNSFLNI